MSGHEWSSVVVSGRHTWQVYNTLLGLSPFEGVSGEVTLGQTSGDRLGRFHITNFQIL